MYACVHRCLTWPLLFRGVCFTLWWSVKVPRQWKPSISALYTIGEKIRALSASERLAVRQIHANCYCPLFINGHGKTPRYRKILCERIVQVYPETEGREALLTVWQNLITIQYNGLFVPPVLKRKTIYLIRL